MRNYYLQCSITCDECGCHDYLDDGSSMYEEYLEVHIEAYYRRYNGKDLCLECFRQQTDEEKQ